MERGYAFTESDLWAYLATKRDEEEVGVCGDASACVIAEAMRAKYPELSHGSAPPRGVFVRSDGDGDAVMEVWGADIDAQCFLLSPVLSRVMRVFDYGAGRGLGASVTKAEFMQAWQAFLTEQGECSDFLLDGER